MDQLLCSAVDLRECDEAQAKILELATELEQVKRERDLLQLSVNGLKEVLGKHQRLSAVRLARAKKAELALEMQGQPITRKRKLTPRA
jgi:hypothetical protein